MCARSRSWVGGAADVFGVEQPPARVSEAEAPRVAAVETAVDVHALANHHRRVQRALGRYQRPAAAAAAAARSQPCLLWGAGRTNWREGRYLGYNPGRTGYFGHDALPLEGLEIEPPQLVEPRLEDVVVER
eukprot:6179582-Pleurochrysis_carterae.AAC.1